MADISIKVVLGILFLFFSNADFEFGIKKRIYRSYTTIEALPTAKKIKIINKYEFVKVILDRNSNNFVIYITVLGAFELIMPTHSLLALLLADL